MLSKAYRLKNPGLHSIELSITISGDVLRSTFLTCGFRSKLKIVFKVDTFSLGL